MLNIIGGMRHQVAGPGFIEIWGRKGLNMSKKSVAQALFDPARCAHEATSPYVSEKTYQDGNPYDIKGIG